MPASLSNLEQLCEDMRWAPLGPSSGSGPTNFTLGAAAAWLEGVHCGGDAMAAAKLLQSLQAAQLITFAGTTVSLAITPALIQQHPDIRLTRVADLPIPATLGQPLNAHFKFFGEARPAQEVR
jgi:hypothetical protein